MTPEQGNGTNDGSDGLILRLAAGERFVHEPRYCPHRLRAYDPYVTMLDEVEQAARTGYTKGGSAAEVAASFSLPPSLGEGTLTSHN